MDMEKKLTERAAESPWLPLAARVYDVVVLDAEGNNLVPDEGIGLALYTTRQFCELLIEREPATEGTWLYGLDLPRLLRLAWLEGAAEARQRGDSVGPTNVWRTGDFAQSVICDPYAAALNTVELRNQISPGALASYLGIDYPENLGSSALAQAQFARNLTLALGL